MISSALSAILLASTANTFLAPALAANRDRIPVPQPTSMTILSLKRDGLERMKLAYVEVRTVSLSIVQ